MFLSSGFPLHFLNTCVCERCSPRKKMCLEFYPNFVVDKSFEVQLKYTVIFDEPEILFFVSLKLC